MTSRQTYRDEPYNTSLSAHDFRVNMARASLQFPPATQNRAAKRKHLRAGKMTRRQAHAYVPPKPSISISAIPAFEPVSSNHSREQELSRVARRIQIAARSDDTLNRMSDRESLRRLEAAAQAELDRAAQADRESLDVLEVITALLEDFLEERRAMERMLRNLPSSPRRTPLGFYSEQAPKQQAIVSVSEDKSLPLEAEVVSLSTFPSSACLYSPKPQQIPPRLSRQGSMLSRSENLATKDPKGPDTQSWLEGAIKEAMGTPLLPAKQIESGLSSMLLHPPAGTTGERHDSSNDGDAEDEDCSSLELQHSCCHRSMRRSKRSSSATSSSQWTELESPDDMSTGQILTPNPSFAMLTTSAAEEKRVDGSAKKKKSGWVTLDSQDLCRGFELPTNAVTEESGAGTKSEKNAAERERQNFAPIEATDVLSSTVLSKSLTRRSLKQIIAARQHYGKVAAEERGLEMKSRKSAAASRSRTDALLRSTGLLSSPASLESLKRSLGPIIAARQHCGDVDRNTMDQELRQVHEAGKPCKQLPLLFDDASYLAPEQEVVALEDLSHATVETTTYDISLQTASETPSKHAEDALIEGLLESDTWSEVEQEAEVQDELVQLAGALSSSEAWSVVSKACGANDPAINSTAGISDLDELLSVRASSKPAHEPLGDGWDTGCLSSSASSSGVRMGLSINKQSNEGTEDEGMDGEVQVKTSDSKRAVSMADSEDWFVVDGKEEVDFRYERPQGHAPAQRHENQGQECCVQ